MPRTRTWMALSAGIALCATACSAEAEPDEPAQSQSLPTDVTFVVPTDPGGGQDLMGRTIASAIEDLADGTTVAVENRPGGSTVTAYTSLLQEEGDPGFLATATTGLISMPLVTETPYTWQDFTPVAIIGEDTEMMVVPADSPYESINDLLQQAESSELSVAVAGATGPDAIVTSLLEEAADVQFRQVVFQSGGESMAAVLAGDADFLMTNPGEVMGQLQSGDLRAIAVFTEDRYPEGSELADVPTAIEQGVDVTFAQFRGVIAPGGIEESDREAWVGVLEEWTGEESYKDYVEENLILPQFVTGDELRQYLTDYEDDLKSVL